MSTFTIINPSTATPVKDVALADLAATDLAIDKAARAFESWKKVAPGDRAKLLRKFAAVIDSHIEELAQLEVLNSGHTIGNARWEAGNVRDVLNYYSAAPERLFGKQIPVPNGIDNCWAISSYLYPLKLIRKGFLRFSDSFPSAS